MRTKLKRSVAGIAHYGTEIVAALADKNIFATQFHPEKSQVAGLTLLRLWCFLPGPLSETSLPALAEKQAPISDLDKDRRQNEDTGSWTSRCRFGYRICSEGNGRAYRETEKGTKPIEGIRAVTHHNHSNISPNTNHRA